MSSAARSRADAAGTMAPAASLRSRLTWLLLAAVLVTALAQALITWRSASAETEAVFDAQMERMALSLSGGLAADVLGSGVLSATRDAEELIIQIWRNDGIMLYRSPSRRLLPQQATPGFATVRAGGEDWRVYALQTASQVVQIAQAQAARRRMAGRLALRAALPVLLLAPVLMLMVWWVIGHALAPVARLRLQLAQRRAGDLQPLPSAGLPAEVLPLVAAMNGLLARLEQAWRQLSSFTADAAHELRSPLAALRLQVQALQRAPDAAAREQALQRLLAGVDRATRLVEQMLALARYDGSGADAAGFVPVDLALLARQCIQGAGAQAASRGLDLTLIADKDAVVSGQQEALMVLLRNLIANALHYTPEGGRVQVRVSRGAAGALQLSVEDSGPGIAEAERARVRDRFYRVPGTAGHGSGLGLAIVQAIAQRHGAELQVTSSAGLGGACMVVRWPADTRPHP